MLNKVERQDSNLEEFGIFVRSERQVRLLKLSRPNDPSLQTVKNCGASTILHDSFYHSRCLFFEIQQSFLIRLKLFRVDLVTFIRFYTRQ